MELPCRTCNAPAGSGCTTKPQPGGEWVRVLSYNHSTRWRDFNEKRNRLAAMADWNQKYGPKPEAS